MSHVYFDKLDVLTRIQGTLINKTPLRVGVGRVSMLGSSMDIAVLRMKLGKDNVPYIPGSSLKGVLRSFAESILKGQGKDVHSPWDFNKIDEEIKKGDYCLICRVFGNTGIASHIRIYDAYPEGPVFTEIKTSVGMNRDFMAAHPGVLYTEEYVVPYTKWKFMMDVINIWIYPKPRGEEGELIWTLLSALREGLIQVGARKTIGYGLIRLEKARYVVYEVKNGVLVKSLEGEIHE